MTDGENTVYPDILVVDEANGSIVMVGEIETASSVTTSEAEQWKMYGAMSKTFYLYVPEGTQGDARQFGWAANITGLRSYGVGADGTAVITNA